MRILEKDREIQILRGMLKLAARKNTRLMKANEYQRQVGELAKELGASASEVREILDPLVREAMEEMIS